MKEDQFDIRMEKVDDYTSNDKYAIIGYFREQQKKHNEVVARMAAQADPASALNAPAPQQSPTNGVTTKQVVPSGKKHYRLSHILADSSADQWLLALIAFLLFLNLICKE